MREGLVLMAKAPLAGQVKTRLIDTLGAEEAAELYANFLRDTFVLMECLRDERENLSLILCYTPEGAEAAFENIEREGSMMLPQRGEDLGERLINCFSDLFEYGFDSLVVIGGDSPTLPLEILFDSFESLKDVDDLVIGPTADDGYYLIGMRCLHTELFTGIPWSTDGVLGATRDRAAEAGLKLIEMPQWYDIDTPEDLQFLKNELRNNGELARHTFKFLKL